MPHREGLRRPRHLLVGQLMKAAALGAVVALLASTSAAAQTSVTDDKPVFLVADLIVGEGVAIDKDAAREVLASRFGRLKDKLEVRSMAEAKATIDAVAMAQLMGSGNDEDLARVEGYLQVDRLVIGRVTQVAGVTDIQVKVFNTKEGVTEVSFARRLGKNAEPSLVLTLLDTLADSLLAWTIDTYTDGSMSAAATKLANKKLTPTTKKTTPADGPSPWSFTGVAGGLGLGVGVGAAGVGVYNALALPPDGGGGFNTANIALIGVGGAVALLGGTAIAVDLGNGAE